MPPSVAEDIMNEVKMYGGQFPLRRCDIYKEIIERTGNKKMADRFAFSGPAINAEPMSLEDWKKIIFEEEE